MNGQKISISVPANLVEFVASYQEEHHCRTRSEVIVQALRLLQRSQLEACYHEANSELDNDFDSTIGDGIDDHEAW